MHLNSPHYQLIPNLLNMAQFQLKLAGLAGVRETNHYIYDDFLTANQAEAQLLLEKNPPDAIFQPWAAGKGV